MPKEFFSPGDAARKLNLSTSRLRQLEQLGELRACRDSAGRRFYDSTEIAEFIRKREAQRRRREQPSQPQPAA
jgi:DNA-binding transcriptional MerR regulator